MNFFGRATKIFKEKVKKVTAQDLHENLAEYNETVTQILIGMHAELNALKNKIESISETAAKDDNALSRNKGLHIIVYAALMLSVLSIIVSLIK